MAFGECPFRSWPLENGLPIMAFGEWPFGEWPFGEWPLENGLPIMAFGEWPFGEWPFGEWPLENGLPIMAFGEWPLEKCPFRSAFQRFRISTRRTVRALVELLDFYAGLAG